NAAVIRLEVVHEPVRGPEVALPWLALAGSPMQIEVAETPLRNRDRVVLAPDVPSVVEHRDAGPVEVGVVGRLLEKALVVLAARLLEGALVDLRRLMPEGELARTAAAVGRSDPAEIPQPGRDAHCPPRTSPSV